MYAHRHIVWKYVFPLQVLNKIKTIINDLSRKLQKFIPSKKNTKTRWSANINFCKNFVPHGGSIVLCDLLHVLCLTDENENEKPPVEDVVKRDYSENRNMYRDDEQVSLCVERYEERSWWFSNILYILREEVLKCQMSCFPSLCFFVTHNPLKTTRNVTIMHHPFLLLKLRSAACKGTL